MLEILSLVILVSLVSIIPGLLALLAAKKSTTVAINEQKLAVCFFMGLSIISLLSAWLTLFLPLLFFTLLLFLLIASIVLLLNRNAFKWKRNINYSEHKIEIAFFIIASLLYLQLGSQQPYMADTNTYHIQIVRWCQQYKAIPGLANLGPRYGFPSNWFHLISIFSFSLNQGNLQYLNTALSIWATLFLLSKIIEHKSKLEIKEHKLFAFVYISIFAFMAVGWNLLRGNCRSLGNDFIVTVLTTYVLLSIAESHIQQRKDHITLSILIFLAVSIPFFKLSGSFIIVLLYIYLIQQKQPLKVYGYSILLLLLFAIPFIFKNYIQTGYPLFPYTFLDFLSPDWKLPSSLMERFKTFNYLSNKFIYQGIPDYAWYDSSFDWLNSWFFKMALYDRALIILFFISLPLFLVRKNWQNSSFRKIAIFLISVLPILIAWFCLSPDPRFIYAYFFFDAFLLIAFTITPIISDFMLNSIYKLLLTAISIFFIFKILSFNGPYVKALNATKPIHSKVLIGNKFFNIPQKTIDEDPGKCADIPIPCIYQVNPHLQMRGKNFSEGFRMNQSFDSTFIKTYIF